jgi:hypothetical protein
MPSFERGEIYLNRKKTGRMAVGLFVILSVVVFGSLLFTCFTCVNNNVLSIDSDGGMEEGIRTGDSLQSEWRVDPSDPIPLETDAEPVGYDKGIDRGDFVILPT